MQEKIIEIGEFEKTLSSNEMTFTLNAEHPKKNRTFSELGCVAFLENVTRWCEGKLINEIKKSFRNNMALKGIEVKICFKKTKEVSMK